MSKTLTLTLIITIVLAMPLLIAQNQPSSQYNKIFLNPFYRQSMSSNTNYTYNVTINPPDKVSSVSSAIIQIDVYLTPTVNYDLWVNGKTCNNPRYTVSTTYAGASQGTLYFDCSNIITKAGTYTVTLRADKNSGSSTAWIDLTYSNNPKGSMKVHGTEYVFGQIGKVWLQLLDNNGTPVTDGVCYTDIYTPDGDELIERATMVNMEHDGIYYYDIPIEENNGEGVFPAIAICYYLASEIINYAISYFVEIGTYNAGAITQTYAIDNSFLRFRESSTNPVRNISVGLNFTNDSICNVSEDLLTGVTIRTVTRFDSVANDDITIHIWNYTSGSWLTLPNKASEGNAWRDVSNSLVLNNISTAGLVNGSYSNVRIRFNDTNLTDGGTNDLDIDYAVFMCDVLDDPSWEELRGSSELHVSAPINVSVVAENIWSYNGTVNPNLLSQFSQSIWNYFNSTMNFIGLIANAVWTYTPDRNLTYYPNTTAIANVTIVINQTNVTTNITLNNTDLTDYNRINEGVWNYTNRTLTDFDFIVNVNMSSLNLTEIAENVWSYNNRSLTFYQVNNITPQDVWEYINRTLTDYNQTAQTDLTDYDKIQTMVWNATDRNLTYYEDKTNYTLIAEYFNTIAYDINQIPLEVWNYTDRNLTYYEVAQVNETAISVSVWDYYNRTLTYYEINDITSEEIWNYTDRNLTYYPAQTDLTNYTLITELINNRTDITNYTLIADMVWTNLNRSLTEFNFDVVNESEISETVWNYFNRTLSDFDFTVNTNLTINTTEIADAVWSNVNRTLTDYNQTTQFDLTNYSLVQEVVWNATSRTLTSFGFDVVDEGEIAENVWTYTPDRNLTYYELVNVTNLTVNIDASQVAQEVWNYNGTVSDNILAQFRNYIECSLDRIFNIEEGWGVDIPAC